MKKKIIGIISVVISCISYGIFKHFFDKDREKKREEENKIVHDSVEKIFSESRNERMEKLDLEFKKEMEESKKKHEEELEKMKEEYKEKMKELEEKRQEQTKILDELDKRRKARDERFNNAKNLDEKLKALDENRKDIIETFYSIYNEKRKTSGQKLADVLEAKFKEIKINN